LSKRLFLLVNILVVGSGGREHAFSWKLSQSPKVDTVFTAPGNGGTENNIPINVDDLDGLSDFAKKNNCFTVVGPETPLAAGIVDKFNQLGLKIFGPSKQAAQLESSKIWAKNFMKRNDIPSARFEIFDDAQKAQDYVQSLDYNVVVKADGLAAGKGVIVCNSNEEAFSAIQIILVKKTFGDAGNRIIVEERVDGIESSYIALSDGEIAIDPLKLNEFLDGINYKKFLIKDGKAYEKIQWQGRTEKLKKHTYSQFDLFAYEQNEFKRVLTVRHNSYQGQPGDTLTVYWTIIRPAS